MRGADAADTDDLAGQRSTYRYRSSNLRPEIAGQCTTPVRVRIILRTTISRCSCLVQPGSTSSIGVINGGRPRRCGTRRRRNGTASRAHARCPSSPLRRWFCSNRCSFPGASPNRSTALRSDGDVEPRCTRRPRCASRRTRAIASRYTRTVDGHGRTPGGSCRRNRAPGRPPPTLAASRFTSHSNGPGSVSSKSLMLNTSLRSGERERHRSSRGEHRRAVA